MMRRVFKFSLKLSAWATVTVLVLLLAWAFQSRSMPELGLWHRIVLEEEFSADDVEDDFTFVDYLSLEDRLFEELRTRVIEAQGEGARYAGFHRFAAGGRNNPLDFKTNWNRSFERRPQEIKGGAVLIHGLTDSPYSHRATAEILFDEGYHVVGLRLPGHGTAPSGLTEARWEDWMAATRLAVRHVAEGVGAEKPLLIVGHSTGGALGLKYAMEALDDSALRRPDRIISYVPAVGVTAFAALAHLHVLYSFIPYFEKSKWLSILPEYDPYKYVSFSKHAADQSHELSTALQEQLAEVAASGRMRDLPPILSFQSIVDDTILVQDTIQHLYDRVDNPESELVLFDINRQAGIGGYITNDPQSLIRDLECREDRKYRLTVVTNASESSRALVANSRAAGETEAQTTPLGVSWPRNVYSLSHVALPFPPDDPIYGTEVSSDAKERSRTAAHLGAMTLRGERNLLLIPANDYMRLRHNPFFRYVEKRLREVASRR